MADNTHKIVDEVQASTISGLETGHDTCADGITAFLAEDCTAVSARTNHAVRIGGSIAEPSLQDIKAYFERPRLVSGGAIPVGRGGIPGGTNITRATIFGTSATALNSAAWFPEALMRLRGTYAVRFSLKFRLMVNASPFHQGLVCLCFEHDNAYLGNVGAFRRTDLPITSTYLPHVVLDLSESTSCELFVPYTHRLEHFPILPSQTMTAGLAYGSVAMHNLVSCPTIADNTRPTFKLYVSLHDLELIAYDSLVEKSVTFSAQAGRVVDREKEEARPLSTLAASAASAIRFIARGVPALSSVAGVGAFIMDGAAGALRAWGYSRPITLTHSLQTTFNRDPGVYNVDLPLQSKVISPFKASSLPHTSEFAGTDVDEMALDYVLSQYSQIAVGNLTPAMAAGFTSYAAQVTPAMMWFINGESLSSTFSHSYPLTNSATGNCFMPSTVFYVCAPFRAWSGGFMYRFTFCKTKFHAGRIAVTFNPGGPVDGLAPNYSNSRLTTQTTGNVPDNDVSGYTSVFDLRDSSVLEFTVPYVHERPMCGFWNSIGTISMHIVDPIICPGTVAQVIHYLVEVKAAPGFRPASLGPLPYPIAGDCNNLSFVSQSGAVSLYKDPDQHTVGERFNSIKQLIMVPSTFCWNTGVPVKSIFTLPRWFTFEGFTMTTPMATTSNVYLPLSAYFASMYKYVRGGTQVALHNSGTNMAFRAYQATMPDTGTAASLMNDIATYNGNYYLPTSTVQSLQACALTATTVVTFPGHAYTKRVLSHLYNNLIYAFPSATARPQELSEGYMASNCIQYTNVVANAELQINISAADDAACGYFLGPRPLLLFGTATRTVRPEKVNQDVVF